MNKKRILAIFAAFLMLCGCTSGKSDKSSADSEDTKQSVAEQSEVTTVNEEDEKLPEKQLSDVAEEICDGFYMLECMDAYDIMKLDENTLVIPEMLFEEESEDASEYGASRITVNIVDSVTGEVLKTHSETCSHVEVLNGYIITLSETESTIRVFDKEMNLVSENKVIGKPNSIMNTDEDTAILYNFDGCEQTWITVEDDGELNFKRKTVPLEAPMEFSAIIGAYSDDVVFIDAINTENWESCPYYWDIRTNELIPMNELVYFNLLGDNILDINSDTHEVSVYSIDTPNIKKTFEYPNGYCSLNSFEWADNLYFSCSDENNLSIKRYSIETGCCTASIDIPCGEYSGVYSVAEVGENVFLTGDINGNYSVFVWQPTDTSEKSEQLFPLLINKNKSQIDELRQKILNDYGIEVYSGEEGVKYFNDYAVVTETDENKILSTMKTIDSFCGKFPEGFFDEMKSAYSDEGTISIYLTGTILPNDYNSNSIDNAAAFTYMPEYDERVMVVDINQYSIEENLAHEFMHAIEDVILTKSFSDESNIENFERWNSLNPEGFDYLYTYTDEDGTTIGSTYTESDYVGTYYYEGGDIPVDNIYFAEEYSTTYRTEDIATIFDEIFMSSEEPLPDYFQSENIQLKAAYICACIRDAFECMEGKSVCWEKDINPEYTLEYFRENHDKDMAFG